MRNFKNVLALALFFVGAALMAQSTLTGVVVDENNMPLPGADVTIKGTTKGTVTDFDGNFSLDCQKSAGEVLFNYMGYNQRVLPFAGSKNFGTVKLTPSANTLDEVVVVGKGLVDLVKDRQTPISATTIKGITIQERLGNLEFPESLKGVPSVHSLNTGGYGDGSYTVRGFDQANVLVLINGQPVNDMEWGGIYWSNWSGLADVASVVQQQRGLGSSKIGIPSVGGTTNIVTKASDKSEGGFLKGTVGNDGFFKSTLSYDTGLNENGWAASGLLSYWQGNGYMDATEGLGGTYFFSLGYKPMGKHSFNFTITGAPQQHQQDYQERISTYEKYGYRYNSNWGYRDGEVFNFSTNWYHKPIANLNWDWDINTRTSLSTVLYGSWGLGGGSGTFGTAHYKLPDDENGLIKIDDLIRANSGAVVDGFGTVPEWDGALLGDNRYGNFNDKRVVTEYGPGTVLRSSVNQHSWYGTMLNLNHSFTDELKLNVGLDLRKYLGKHYRVLHDLLGADAYFDTTDVNSIGVFATEELAMNPLKANDITTTQKLDRNFDSAVKWAGLFGQLEYANEYLSTFVQGSIANQYYKRYEYFEVPASEQATDWSSKFGGNIKGGFNYKFNSTHNAFINAGYFSRQPFFSALYPNSYTSTANEMDDVKNEKIFSIEGGYGYRTNPLDVVLNVYRTTWDNKYASFAYTTDTRDRYSARSSEFSELHQGVELEITARPNPQLDIFGMLSYGDWKYKKDVNVDLYDNLGAPVNQNVDIYIDGIETGGSPQFQTRLGANYEFPFNLSLDADWYYNAKNYAFITPDGYDEVGSENLEMPSYHLFDMGLTYKIDVNSNQLNLRLNVNNLFDTLYVARGYSNYSADTDDTNNWNGINKSNTVEFGFGRTWNASLTYKF